MGRKPFDLSQVRNRVVELRMVRAGDIRDHPAQWRDHPEAQAKAMDGVLREIGIAGAILAWHSEREGGALTSIDGHLRRGLDPDKVWPVLVTDLTDEEADYALATHDPLSMMAQADKAALDALLSEVRSGEAGVQQMLADLAKEAGLYGEPSGAEDPGAQVDRAEELREKWGVKAGDLWLIGRHRLLCGDSTNEQDVQCLMDGRRALLLATDPPYNVGIEYGEGVDDSKAEQDYHAFTEAWFGLWQAASERQIVTPGRRNIETWCRWFPSKTIGCWMKNNAINRGKASMFACWEPVFFFGEHWKRTRANDIFDYPVSNQANVANHPCPKPLPMWVDLFENYSEPGDLVADAFCGSGTAIVAAEQTKRICVAMELEPKYIAVSLERLALMGLDPRLAE